MRKWLLKDSIHDSGCSLKAYRRECFEELDLYGEMHRFMPALLELDGFTVTEVKVRHHARKHGVTKYNWKRGVKGITDMIYIWFWRNYRARPLHFFTGFGLCAFLFGAAILLWMMIEKVFFGASLSERIWPLMGVTFVILGVQMFALGLLADIISKTYFKSHGRMNYKIKEVEKRE
jgi:hypothetical protein